MIGTRTLTVAALLLIAGCGAPPKLATCSQHAGMEHLRQLDNPDVGEVGGSVTDSATCAPLAGIAIDAVSSRGELSVITNDEGRYLATRLAPGTYTLSLHACAVTIQREVAITGGYATQLDFAMNQQLCAER